MRNTCRFCGRNAGRFKTCKRHRDAITKRERMRLALHRFKGGCTKCGKKTAPGRQMCTSCTDYMTAYVTGLRADNEARGMCKLCGRRKPTTRTLRDGTVKPLKSCKSCLAKRVMWNQSSRSKRR